MRPASVSLPDLLIGDGRPPLAAAALGLVVAGLFAFFVSATGTLLPHDIEWLGMEEPALRAIADGAVVDFMFHDRVAFGGTLIAVGTLYLWLIAGPLAERRAWAWWLLAASTALGFASFLGWLGFGYLDVWHAVATAALLPLFAVGLWRTRGIRLRQERPERRRPDLGTRAGLGRGLLLLTGLGMVVAGTTILTIGSFVVFVPQDLVFLGLERGALDAINPRLVPLIAHDRSGFGGGLATAGIVVLGVVWYGRPGRALWQALLVAGGVGFGAAIGIHGLIGYLDATHVAPAVGGALVFALGMVLVRPDWLRSGQLDRDVSRVVAAEPASRRRAA